MWLEGKKHILPYFPEETGFRVSQEITGEPDQEEMNSLFTNLHSRTMELLRDERFKVLDRIDAGEGLFSFVEGFTTYFTSFDELVQNKLTEDKSLPNGEVLKKGMKVSKALLRFIKASEKVWSEECSGRFANYKGHEQLVIEAASIIFSNLIEAIKTMNKETVVLSVNPLDIMFQAMFTQGSWKTCHRIGGEWATGPISMAVDKSTVVAWSAKKSGYVPYGDDREGSFLWPLKTWRQLMFVSDSLNVAYLSREYRQEIAGHSRIARHLLGRIMCSANEVEHKWRISRFNGGSFLVKEGDPDEVEPTEVGPRVTKEGEWHYPDSLRGRIRLNDAPSLDVFVGSLTIPCLKCGKPRQKSHGDGRANTYYCYECRNDPCQRCGSSHPVGSIKTEAGPMRVCQDCMDRSLHCDDCGNRTFDTFTFREGNDRTTYRCAICIVHLQRAKMARQCWLCARYFIGSTHYCPDCNQLIEACSYCGAMISFVDSRYNCCEDCNVRRGRDADLMGKAHKMAETVQFWVNNFTPGQYVRITAAESPTLDPAIQFTATVDGFTGELPPYHEPETALSRGGFDTLAHGLLNHFVFHLVDARLITQSTAAISRKDFRPSAFVANLESTNPGSVNLQPYTTTTDREVF